MEWGIPTLIETDTLKASAALCQELGFNFVELNMNLPQYQKLDISLLKDIVSQYGIYFTVHLDEKMDLCDFNPRVADAYLQTLLDTIYAAKQLDIPVLNMHMPQGVYFTLPERKLYLYDKYQSYFLNRISEVASQCTVAAENRLNICIENTGDLHLPFLREAVTRLLKSPCFGLTFDIGHNYSAGDVDQPFILRNRNKLRHFHIHDALGKNNHLPLGTGEMNIPRYIRLAEETHCRAVLEVKTVQGLRNSVDWLKNRDKGGWNGNQRYSN